MGLMKHSIKTEIFGIGNPIYDICANVNQEYLQRLRASVPAAAWGSTHHVGDALFERILGTLNEEALEVVPGGGAFNTLRLLSQLGHECAYSGGLGDSTGLSAERFRREMRRYGIRDYTVRFAGRPCGRSLCLKDGLRELLIFNPAAATLLLNAEQLPLPDKESAPQLIYIEGFILPREDLVRSILSYCKSSSALLAVDLAAAAIAAAKKEFLVKEVFPRTTFLFGTEEEYTATEYPPGELHSMLTPCGPEASARQAGCLVVKKGAAGSTVLCGNRRIEVSAHTTELVNTSGAGDAYAAFFLSELLRGDRPEKAARIASYGSSLVLRRFGGFLDTNTVASVPKKQLTAEIDVS